mmetsp:Transcript_6223/g.9014  ORF Transcript_6223/g.9014 Transcript_6223/m.9014 type:complete len:104 (-) Transcript_6223:418-729(-)|eukprot:CAMPEP_0195518048 /NCGR_PEP_ID=MMETSP0794_2-20130614/12049_1 /TAXON_ID=515487 /ORGANISM="Stephanopyxis turris, Strain CCMP 815" /LENGTH=103 /DNA_ID=CAMNT_0040646951 /DNA_START=170 /DNA_END=481 /DNA_ORIENTATION=+
MATRLLRYQVFLVYGMGFLAAWWNLLQNTDSVVDALSPRVPPKYTLVALRFGPFWAVFLLGLYAFLSVVHGVANLSDCPEAALEIEQQVKEAKEELKKKGVVL